LTQRQPEEVSLTQLEGKTGVKETVSILVWTFWAMLNL
jgi:hypothetical protein